MTNFQPITRPGLINASNTIIVDGDFAYLAWSYETSKKTFILSEFEFSIN
jgi:hypothetical protein